MHLGHRIHPAGPRRAAACSALALLLGLALPAAAQSPGAVRMLDSTPDAAELKRLLFPEATPYGKTRSIRLEDGTEQRLEAEKPQVVGFRIQFAFDSAAIRPESRPFLDTLAQVLREVPEGKLLIEGHTDAIGSDAYNQRLSERRAASVRSYLVRRHGIAPARLVTRGLGERSPLPGVAPTAGVNRRVQFARLD